MVHDSIFSIFRNAREGFVNIRVLVVIRIPQESIRAEPVELEEQSQRISNNNVTIYEGMDSIVGNVS
jgi:hypothetical protein